VGYNASGGTVSNSYSTGSVNGSSFVGGLVGRNFENSTVSNSYSTGSVSGGSSVGGLVGYNASTVSNSFWDTQTSNQSSSSGGTGKTTAEMKDYNTFIDADWDFVSESDNGIEDIWDADQLGTVNDGYMILSWQIGADTTLPVELSSFTATASVDGVTLKWRSETEVGNVGFSIYRSETKKGNYTKLGFVSGVGNSAMPIDYEFTDKSAELGNTYYYYLEDIDIEGNRDSSDIIQVVVPAKSIPKETRLWQNYPNPFNPETWIPYNLSKDAEVLIRIYNV